MADVERRRDVIKALRLIEHAPDNRWPVFVFDEPFEDARLYFLALARAVVAQYEQIRAQAGAAGVELPEHDHGAEGDPIERAGVAVARVAASLAQLVDGVLVALVPGRVLDVQAFRAAFRALSQLPLPPSVRFLVLGDVGDLDARARFEVPRDRLFAFLQALAPEPAARPLRASMLAAWKALGAGDTLGAERALARAVELCRARGQAREFAAALFGLVGAALARGDTERARDLLTDAALRAERMGLASQAEQAWKGLASLAKACDAEELADIAGEATKRAHEALAMGKRTRP
ncbi:hypothetical protein [Polyangium sp. 15x6]|uniref:hypothetical protein n=1 Tax=Polyangium sp. 15x6 TaxID=3042687 RepID=UPI00249C9067|nr:hypothetical protein [Polyangium sp. 15x6]MDI3291659.1 hypothetical protein [Polyangium sp. 15x6]